MEKKTKLKKILSILQPEETQADFKLFDEQVQTLKDQLKEKITVKTLDDVNAQLEKFKRRIDFDPLIETIKRIETIFNSKSEELLSQLDSKSKELQELILSGDNSSTEKSDLLKQEIGNLETQIAINEATYKGSSDSLRQDIENLRQAEDKTNKTLKELQSTLNATLEDVSKNKNEKDELEKVVNELQKTLEKIRKDLLQRISNIGGGAMNRQNFIGNVDPLTRYTDINWKAGSNVTLTYANNDTTKRVDITIAATGGSGTTRQIQTTTISSVIAGLAGIDQVTLANGGVVITLPTAVSDTSLYTIKNVGVSSVLVATTGGQTIDGSANIIMPVQFTSVDLISDNSNWNVT